MNIQIDLIQFIAIFLGINILTFLIYGLDKYKAIKGQWRIPEKTLLLFALALGGIGAFAGMKVFRHKTKTPIFYIGVPFLIFVNIISIYFIFKYIVK